MSHSRYSNLWRMVTLLSLIFTLSELLVSVPGFQHTMQFSHDYQQKYKTAFQQVHWKFHYFKDWPDNQIIPWNDGRLQRLQGSKFKSTQVFPWTQEYIDFVPYIGKLQLNVIPEFCWNIFHMCWENHNSLYSYKFLLTSQWGVIRLGNSCVHISYTTLLMKTT